MKKISLLPLLAIVSSVPLAAHADQAAIQRDNSLVWLSVGAKDLNYKEQVSAPDLPDSERGWITSGQAGVSYMDPGEQFISLDSSLSYGDAKYRGALFFFPTTPVDSTTTETFSETNLQLGQGVPLSQDITLMPYVEGGYRLWNRQLSGDQREHYRNYDVLGGLALDVTPTPKTFVSAFASAGSTVAPQMHTAGLTFNLGRDAMYKFGGKLGYDFAPRWQVFGTADYDYFRYQHSGVVDNFAFEPSSSTGETNLRVGVGYMFK